MHAHALMFCTVQGGRLIVSVQLYCDGQHLMWMVLVRAQMTSTIPNADVGMAHYFCSK